MRAGRSNVAASDGHARRFEKRPERNAETLPTCLKLPGTAQL